MNLEPTTECGGYFVYLVCAIHDFMWFLSRPTESQSLYQSIERVPLHILARHSLPSRCNGIFFSSFSFFPFFGSASLMNHSFLNLLHDIHEYATSFMLVVCWCMLRARVDSSVDQVAFESCIRYSKQEYESTVWGKSSGKRKKKKGNHRPFTAGPFYESLDS